VRQRRDNNNSNSNNNHYNFDSNNNHNNNNNSYNLNRKFIALSYINETIFAQFKNIFNTQPNIQIVLKINNKLNSII